MKISEVNANFFSVLRKDEQSDTLKAKIMCSINLSDFCPSPVLKNKIQTYNVIGKEIECYFTKHNKIVCKKCLIIEVKYLNVKIYTVSTCVDMRKKN